MTGADRVHAGRPGGGRIRRLTAETATAARSFLRRRVAVFFTFLFPVILVGIFGALVQTGPSSGLFGEPNGYYVPGYLAVVVLFTPLSRVSSEVARHREGNRFEKLATTPLTRAEWLLAQTLVNVALVGAAAALVLGIGMLVAPATLRPSPMLLLTVPAGTVLFCGFGALLGRLADSRDGAITAANAVGLPLVFLSDTFVPPSMLPEWFGPLLALSPLTYFARATREAIYVPPGPERAFLGEPPVPGFTDAVVLAALAVAFFAAGTAAIPRTD